MTYSLTESTQPALQQEIRKAKMNLSNIILSMSKQNL